MDQFNKVVTGWNGNARLVVTTCRYESGSLVGFITQIDDEDIANKMAGAIMDDSGWQHLMSEHPWYPFAIGESVEEIIQKLKEHVNKVSDERLSEWQSLCLTFEHDLISNNVFDTNYYRLTQDYNCDLEFKSLFKNPFA